MRTGFETTRRPGYEIVQGDPVAHRQDVVNLGIQSLPAARESWESRYPKYYEHNPLGPPSLFLAKDAASQEFVGTTALFPTALRVCGELVPAGIVGDFAVDPHHRTLGPAITLQRAVLAKLPERGLSCLLGTPSALADPVIDRVGWSDLGCLTRFVKVLKSRVVAERYAGDRIAGRIAAGLSTLTVDPILAVTSREHYRRRDRAFSVEHPRLFDDRFADVWEAARREFPISSERTVELLNWRFEKSGSVRTDAYTLFALMAASQVAGYVVYRMKNGIRDVVDILFLPSQTIADALLAEFIRDTRRARAKAISVLYLGPENLLTRRLRAFGFLRRTDPAKLRVYTSPNTSFRADPLQAENWYFLGGDRDM
jgi:Acetyltransferase (GNAT) domain